MFPVIRPGIKSTKREMVAAFSFDKPGGIFKYCAPIASATFT